MSGICGWFTTSQNTASPDIKAMARSLHSPLTGDGWQRSELDLGLAAAAPPRVQGAPYHNEFLWVACQGAAYFNEPALLDIAARRGAAAAIAEGYLRKGVGCLDDIHGPFVLAVLDRRAGRALLAIDRVGVHPLCLAPVPGGIVFGSTTDSVVAHPAVSAQVDPQSLYDYLYFHMIPSPRTIYRGVEKLLPGQYALLENGRLDKRFYWDMQYCDEGGAPQTQLADEFRALLRQTVRRSLATPHTKAGNFLSGGTDSSTLAGIVTEVTGRPADTYSIGFDAEGFDESRYAEIAVKHFNTRHHTYYVTPQDVVDAIPLIANAYDEPFGNASAVPTYLCAKLARQDGVDLMLAGDGGDELFGGNVRYAKQKGFELYAALPALLRRGLLEPLAFRLPGARTVPPLRKLRSYINQAKVPLPDRLESYNFLHRSPASDILQEAFLAEIDVDEPLANMREVYERTRSTDTLHRMLHLDLKNTLADNDLRKVNRMCELAGSDVSYPLLDDAMVRFSGLVPSGLKVKGFTLRYFFKDSLKGFLPPEILKKSKHGFGLPFGPWMTRHAPLRELVEDSLQTLRGREYINAQYVDNLLSNVHQGHAAYYGVMIWVLVMLEQWFQRQRPRPSS